MDRLVIRAFGMMTGAGLDGPSACAAIRASVDNFAETRFMARGGRWIVGSQVPLERAERGLAKHVTMAASVIRECLTRIGADRTEDIPLYLCVAELDRPGRLSGLDDRLLRDVQVALGRAFHRRSQIIALGRVSGVVALTEAWRRMSEERLSTAIIAGVDSLLSAETLQWYDRQSRLLTNENSNGFVPGEAAGAVLLTRDDSPRNLDPWCEGLGGGVEPATIDSDLPLRADGLAAAISAALADAQCDFAAVHGIISDANGEQYFFREGALAQSRLMRQRVAHLDVWQPADCVGEIGAAVVPCVLGLAHFTCRKRAWPGDRLLAHFSGHDGRRAALVLRQPQGAPPHG